MSQISPKKEVDPATLEVIRNRLVSIADEMAKNLDRTAYNSVVFEIRDYGLTIYDKELRSLAASPGSPMFAASNDAAVPETVEYLGEENINKGDVIMLNYPYRSAGHTFDIIVISPIYYDEEKVGYVASRAHTVDVGSKNPGYAIDTTDVHQEGILFPATKIHKNGEPDEEIIDILRHNSRLPDKVMGDINAEISALQIGRDRVRGLYEKYGKEVIESSYDQIVEHGEQVAREAVEELPDGTWTATEHVDGSRETVENIRLELEITIDGSEFTADYSGSSDQVDGPLNIPHGLSKSVTRQAFKMVTTPKRPANAGNYAPLSTVIPEGNIYNPTYPAPTGTLWPGIYIVEFVMKVMGKAAPDRVPAQSGIEHPLATMVGVDPDSGVQFAELPTDVIGWGATSTHDGSSALSNTALTGTRNVPVEVQENRMPLRNEQYKLRQDSAGAGEQRGGLGIRRDYYFEAPLQFLSTMQKTKTRNKGLKGGEPGSRNVVAIRPVDDTWEDRIQLLVDNNNLYSDNDRIWTGLSRGDYKSGEVVEYHTGGGAGYGNPEDREPEKVLEDVIDGYVSRDAAEDDYSVVITEDHEINWEKTNSMRSK